MHGHTFIGNAATILIAALVWPAPAAAEDDTRQQAPSAYEHGVAAMAAGRLGEAEDALRRAIEIEADRVSALGALGTLLHISGRSVEAESLLRRAVAGSAPRSIEEAETRTALGGLLVDTGRIDEAERLASRALKIWNDKVGRRSAERVTALNVLADTKLVAGEWEETERLLREAYRLALAAEERPALRAGVVLRRGLLYMAMGRPHEAEPLLELALELCEEMYGAEHPALLQMTYALATCYRLRNRPREAAALYERFLDVGERTYGPGHAMLTAAVDGLEQASRRLGDPTRAAAYRTRRAGFAGGR